VIWEVIVIKKQKNFKTLIFILLFGAIASSNTCSGMLRKRPRLATGKTVTWGPDQVKIFVSPVSPKVKKLHFLDEVTSEFLTDFITGEFDEIHCSEFFVITKKAESLNISTTHTGILNEKDFHGQRALHWAAALGSTPMVQRLIKKRRHKAYVRDSNNYAPIHWASLKGHEYIVCYLIDRHKVDPNSPNADFSDTTPLHLAALAGHLPVVKALVARGANILEKDAFGQTPLDNARKNGHHSVAAYLAEIEMTDFLPIMFNQQTKDISTQTKLNFKEK